MTKVTRKIDYMADRYKYDFDMCSLKNNYAQIDTKQDASYYGNWANPFELKTVCYCEGDVIITESKNEQKFIQEIRAMEKWNEKHGWGPMKIDPGCKDNLIAKFNELGLSDLLH